MRPAVSSPRLLALCAALACGAAHAQSTPNYEFRAPKRGLQVASGATPAPAPAPTYTAQLSTSALDFGTLDVGTNDVRQVLLTNTGTGTLSLQAPAVQGNAAFSASTNCAATLASGQSCQTDVTFQPTQSGSFSATLLLGSNATGSPLAVSLTGQASVPLTYTAQLSSSSVDFGAVTLDTFGTRQLTLTNTGTGTLSLQAPQLQGDAAFTLGTTCGATLAPQASCDVTLTFTPGSTASVSASLVLGSNATGAPFTVPVTGRGYAYMSATGGTVTTDGDFRVHTFTADGTFTITRLPSEGGPTVLLVAGGGGGAGGGLNVGGGGAGAGGAFTATPTLSATGTLSITIGAGGNGGAYNASGSAGGNTVVAGTALPATLTAIGGGRGGTAPGTGGTGGSGGGHSGAGGTPGQGTAGQGFGGAAGTGTYGYTTATGGGGGGASAAASGQSGGAGLTSNISGASVVYAAGGNGGSSSGSAQAARAANTGHGGHGGNGTNASGSKGGSGVVIIRYRYR